jgi:ATP-dependent RNA helicase DDX5/DBP2
MIAKPVSLKKAKKAAKQRAAAEANAARAEAFMAAKDGRAEAPNKRKAESDDEELAHDALEAAVQSGAAAAERKAAKKAKKAKKERRAPSEDDDDVVDGDAKKPKKPKKSTTTGEDDHDALEERDGIPSSDESSDAEAIAAFMEEHQIKVPADAPKPFITFQSAPFPKRLTAALLKQGYKTPSPIQAQAWPIALTGKDIVAVAKTGSGKTCGFLLPALCRIVKNGACAAPEMEMCDGRFRPAAVTPSAIVLAPTRELAIQIGDECL